MKIQVLALLYQSPKSSRKFFLFSLRDQNPNGKFITLEKRYANLIETFPTPTVIIYICQVLPGNFRWRWKMRKEVLQGSPLKQTAEAIFVFCASIIESSLNFLTLKVIRISICHSVYSKIRHSRKRHDFSLGIFETAPVTIFVHSAWITSMVYGTLVAYHLKPYQLSNDIKRACLGLW